MGYQQKLSQSNPSMAYYSDTQLQQTQQQIDEVTNVMQQNVARVMERDDNLGNLQSRATHMQRGASQFQEQSYAIKKKYWWKNMKWWAIIICITLIVIAIVVGVTVGTTKKQVIEYHEDATKKIETATTEAATVAETTTKMLEETTKASTS